MKSQHCSLANDYNYPHLTKSSFRTGHLHGIIELD